MIRLCAFHFDEVRLSQESASICFEKSRSRLPVPEQLLENAGNKNTGRVRTIILSPSSHLADNQMYAFSEKHFKSVWSVSGLNYQFNGNSTVLANHNSTTSGFVTHVHVGSEHGLSEADELKIIDVALTRYNQDLRLRSEHMDLIEFVQIPQRGIVGSLNVSCALGILLFHLLGITSRANYSTIREFIDPILSSDFKLKSEYTETSDTLPSKIICDQALKGHEQHLRSLLVGKIAPRDSLSETTTTTQRTGEIVNMTRGVSEQYQSRLVPVYRSLQHLSSHELRGAYRSLLETMPVPIVLVICNESGDPSIGCLIRSANAFAVEFIVVVGRKRFNRRCTIGTHQYMDFYHYRSFDSLRNDMQCVHDPSRSTRVQNLSNMIWCGLCRNEPRLGPVHKSRGRSSAWEHLSLQSVDELYQKVLYPRIRDNSQTLQRTGNSPENGVVLCVAEEGHDLPEEVQEMCKYMLEIGTIRNVSTTASMPDHDSVQENAEPIPPLRTVCHPERQTLNRLRCGMGPVLSGTIALHVLRGLSLVNQCLENGEMIQPGKKNPMIQAM